MKQVPIDTFLVVVYFRTKTYSPLALYGSRHMVQFLNRNVLLHAKVFLWFNLYGINSYRNLWQFLAQNDGQSHGTYEAEKVSNSWIIVRKSLQVETCVLWATQFESNYQLLLSETSCILITCNLSSSKLFFLFCNCERCKDRQPLVQVGEGMTWEPFRHCSQFCPRMLEGPNFVSFPSIHCPLYSIPSPSFLSVPCVPTHPSTHPYYPLTSSFFPRSPGVRRYNSRKCFCNTRCM